MKTIFELFYKEIRSRAGALLRKFLKNNYFETFLTFPPVNTIIFTASNE